MRLPQYSFRCRAMLAVCMFTISGWTAAPRASAAEPVLTPNGVSAGYVQPFLPNVVDSFSRLSAEGKLWKFTRDTNAEWPQGGHLQGIQIRTDLATRRHLAFMAHDSDTVAYFLVVEFPFDAPDRGRVIHFVALPGDGETPPLRHAGGFQIAGDLLAVGLEDNQEKARSEVQFWNMADSTGPQRLKHLTVLRQGAPKEQTAGAVGVLRRDRDHLLAVANWDSRAIDFYVTNGRPVDDLACQFKLATTWRVDAADTSDWQPDRSVGPYQSINLVQDGAGNDYLLAFASLPTGEDVCDLFLCDIRRGPGNLLRKLARKTMKLPGDNHFRFASGMWIDGNTLSILASPNTVGDSGTISVVR